MDKVLIASGAEKGTVVLKNLLQSAGYTGVESVLSASEARRKLINSAYQMVIINMPLADETGRELAFQIAETDSAVLVIIKAGSEEIFGRFGTEKGIYVLTKPLNRQTFHDAVRYARSAQHRIMALKEKNRQLLKSLDELKVICKAKCVLVAEKGMTEEEAHHYIEKEAMNLRLTKRQIAERILAVY
ncbi:MAG: ANTAR domain-containing protein [Bacillota bacterium]|nr:ANTAR domain-containing protein [Bacillota bacterium]